MSAVTAAQTSAGAEIGLLQDERDKDQAGQSGRQNCAAEAFDIAHAILQEPCEKEHERGLGNFRWLK